MISRYDAVLLRTSALCRKRPSVLPILFLNPNVGKPCVGGIIVISDEGGTVVGDVGNVKISTFWTFRIFGFFLWVELFLRSDLVRRRRDVK